MIHYEEEITALNSLAHFQHLNSLEIEGAQLTTIITLLQSCSSPSPFEMTVRWPMLRLLSLTALFSTPSIHSNFLDLSSIHSLEYLHIDSLAAQISNESMCKMIRTAPPTLTSIDIDRCNNATTQIVEIIADHYANQLRMLSLYNNAHIDLTDCIIAISKLTHLISFSFIGCKCDSTSLQELVNVLPPQQNEIH